MVVTATAAQGSFSYNAIDSEPYGWNGLQKKVSKGDFLSERASGTDVYTDGIW